ncbi:type I-E CRISPR-associated protein Cse1/CasA [Sorangium sp. So ce513]|uniref:type I-E CRISPR-associated protein Cse1/CasA n=1 Tax=Sorangium sp. So ce513 TaxID=3133315 RepID=UPI003F60EE69
MPPPERPRFDLTREPWIPCETLAGARVELGFEEVLARAHELACVHDESPLATAVIYRLLLAILHRAVDGPRSTDAWEALWNEPRFDPARVRAYLDRFRHRFDLFDAERPFLQVPRLAEVLFAERQGKEAERTPVRRLALERSGYSGSVHLLEHGGDDAGLSPAEAARAMLGFLGFGPGGRILNDSGYPRACPLRPGAVVLARGKTLHRTLLLNLLVLERDRPLPGAGGPGDLPAWEQDTAASRTKRAVRGWLDALTWQARRVELIPHATGAGAIVRDVVTGAGLEPEGDWIEPMQALLVRDEKRGAEPLRFDPDRSLWRDATALFEATDARKEHRRPAVCTQIAWLVENDILERAAGLALDLYGLSSSQAAIELWRAERVPLPIRLLTDAGRVDVLRQALRAAHAVANALRSSVWRLASAALASGERSPDKKDVGSLVDRLAAEPRYWSSLGASFDELLRRLGEDEDTEASLSWWKEVARKAARRSLDDAARQLGTNARAFRARALAERTLAYELAKLSPATTSTPTQEGATA